MLDIKFIRQNADIVKEAALKKNITIDVDRLLVVDIEILELQKKYEVARTIQNEASVRIVSMTHEEKMVLLEDLKKTKADIEEAEEKLKPLRLEFLTLMYRVPNIPDMQAPVGDDETFSKIFKTWGDKKKFAFTPKSHIEIMVAKNMVDFERGIKVHGFRGYYLKNNGALLTFAIWNYARDFFMARGIDEFYITPNITDYESYVGSGMFPGAEDDVYKTQDDQYLIGTSEVPMMSYYRDEIIDVSELPKKILSFSPCYRREAGAHSKDTKGLIRVHEFHKLEQVVICEASHMESVKWHETLNANTEAFIETLGIPYHVLDAATGDMGQAKVRMYDIELWVPLEEKYREISSASYFHDYQTRRANVRYRDKNGVIRFAHSLNCTAIPTPRILVSLVENCQNENGDIIIPEPLRPYLGGKEIL